MSDLIQVTKRMPSLLRAEKFAIVPASINLEARTVDVIASTGASVLRYDWWEGEYYEESLSLDPAHCKLDRLNGGASVLDSHCSWGLSEIIGVTVRSWIENAGLCATLKISDRNEEMEGVWRDIQAGIIRHISIGYRVRKYEIVKEEGKITLWRAVDWEPYEISFVPIPADPGAGVRSFGIEKYRDAQQLPEPCLFLRHPLPSEVNMSDVSRKDPQPNTPAPTLTPEERLRKLEITVQESGARELKLIAENKRLGDEIATLKRANTDTIVAKIDETANQEFTEDRAAGRHYYYTSEAEARREFDNNRERYRALTSAAPVDFAPKAGTNERSQDSHAKANLRSPASPAQLPSASELPGGEALSPEKRLYQAVRKIQDAEKVSYDEATTRFWARNPRGV